MCTAPRPLTMNAPTTTTSSSSTTTTTMGYGDHHSAFAYKKQPLLGAPHDPFQRRPTTSTTSTSSSRESSASHLLSGPSSRTSNCVSRYSGRRRSNHKSPQSQSQASCFFVEGDDGASVEIGSSESNRRATTTVASQRSSPPIELTNDMERLRFTEPPPAPAPSSSQQRIKTTVALIPPAAAAPSITATGRRRKMAAFKNPYTPEVIADRRAGVQSYDELLFNVAGLYHTLSGHHDADYATDDTSNDPTSGDALDQQPPLMERSMQLMIAEFLYRSAVFLGYPPEENVWVPGFRENKKFSSNDVIRWRRLAFFDWQKEEELFASEEAQRQSRRAAKAAAAAGLRATVSQWLHRRPSSANGAAPGAAPGAQGSSKKSTTATMRYVMPPLTTLDVPKIAPTHDISRLVEIANACVSYGAFQFSETSIRKLCNVRISKNE